MNASETKADRTPKPALADLTHLPFFSEFAIEPRERAAAFARRWQGVIAII